MCWEKILHQKVVGVEQLPRAVDMALSCRGIFGQYCQYYGLIFGCSCVWLGLSDLCGSLPIGLL